MLRTLPVILLAAAPAAMAQNALGDGRALESPLQSGGGAPYSNRSLVDTLRFQNAIVTGNAPGGLSFRGDIDYRAPGEFTGDAAGAFTGEPDLQNFRFRRDSFFSGLAGRGIRGTEALQMQFNMMTGSGTPTNLSGSLISSRPNEGAYAANYIAQRDADIYQGRPYSIPIPTAEQNNLAPLDFDDPAYDRSGELLNLRSSATVAANDSLRTEIIDHRLGRDGKTYTITANSLGGVKLIPLETFDPLSNVNPVTKPLDRTIEPAQIPRSVFPNTEETETEEDPGALPHLPGARTYESILKDLDAYELPPVEGLPEGIEQPKPIDLPDAGPEVQAWRQRLLDLRRSLLLEPEFTERDEEGERQRRTDPLTVNLIKGAAGKIDVLSPIGASGVDAYTANMSHAEKLLADGRFFDAEERFARALSLRPGDPMAAVGRIHAQLGAGMYVSASLNMRMLFSNNPELVAATYAPTLLPSPKRIDAIKADLTTRLREDSGLPRESGILLAYLGYQTRDVRTSTRGLDYADDAAAALDDARFTTLVDLMRQVWLPIVTPINEDE